MNDTFMKEKPVGPLLGIHGSAYGLFHACKLAVQHCGQFLCSADQ